MQLRKQLNNSIKVNGILKWMCINARDDNLLSVMPALMKLRSQRMVLALCSHLHDVTGSIQANSNKTYKFGKSSLSHSLRAWAQVVALSLVALLMCMCFHLESSCSKISGDGKSCAHSFVTLESSAFSIEHRIEGTN